MTLSTRRLGLCLLFPFQDLSLFCVELPVGRFHPADGLKRLKIQKPTEATKNQEKNNHKSVKNGQKSGEKNIPFQAQPFTSGLLPAYRAFPPGARTRRTGKPISNQLSRYGLAVSSHHPHSALIYDKQEVLSLTKQDQMA